MESLIHPNVAFASPAKIGPFCIIGEPRMDAEPGDDATVFGRSAVIRSHTVIYAGNRVGDGFQTGHGVLVRENNEIGTDVSIGTHSIVEHHVRLADGVRIHSNVFVPEYSTLAEGAWLGPNVNLTNARYPRSRNVKDTLVGATIGANAKIGAGAVILPGVTVGAHALVGAGAVVTRDVGEGDVVVGNPARAIKNVRDIKEY